ncbi:hypothetical protein Btru_074238 [Bulinus truncatus]|nr:hypothetical protein Btru_074238 [Bulinus truncatus]
MAHRMLTAGIRTGESDIFRFNMVHPPPPSRPTPRQDWVDSGWVLRPKYICRPRAGRSDTALNKQRSLQAQAHLLRPAGISLPPSDMFRHYHVVPSERILQLEIQEARRRGVCYNDGVNTCCPETFREIRCICRPARNSYHNEILRNVRHLSPHKHCPMSGHGIFAESKEKGLEEFRQWCRWNYLAYQLSRGDPRKHWIDDRQCHSDVYRQRWRLTWKTRNIFLDLI